MGGLGVADNVRASQLFPKTVYGQAMAWFKNLRPSSILCYNQLLAKFSRRFENLQERVCPVNYISEIVQRENERLRSFIRKFEEATTIVEYYTMKE